MEERKRKEIEFHNMRERERMRLDEESFLKKHSNKKYYSIIKKSREYYLQWIRSRCRGKRVLDYCCGLGEISVELAKHGAIVQGIDISDESVSTAQKVATAAGLSDVTKFDVMDAENLAFDDNTFDIIVCSGVLHHLDLKYAYSELARVLRPDGEIICIEALGYNPLINLYRHRTLHIRTAWEADHILTLREVRWARAYFKGVRVRYFHLFSLLAVPFRNTAIFRPLLAILEWVDAVVLRVPGIKLMAWQMIFELKEPRAQH